MLVFNNFKMLVTDIFVLFFGIFALCLSTILKFIKDIFNFCESIADPDLDQSGNSTITAPKRLDEKPDDDESCNSDWIVLTPKEKHFTYPCGVFNINGGVTLRSKVKGLSDLVPTSHSYCLTKSGFRTDVKYHADNINICYEVQAYICNLEAQITISPSLENVSLIVEFEDTQSGNVKCNLGDVRFRKLCVTTEVSGRVWWMVDVIFNLILKCMPNAIHNLYELFILFYWNPLQSEFSVSNIYFPIDPLMEPEEQVSSKLFKRILNEYLHVTKSVFPLKFSRDWFPACRECFLNREYYLSCVFVGNIMLNLRGLKSMGISCRPNLSTGELSCKVTCKSPLKSSCNGQPSTVSNCTHNSEQLAEQSSEIASHARPGNESRSAIELTQSPSTETDTQTTPENEEISPQKEEIAEKAESKSDNLVKGRPNGVHFTHVNGTHDLNLVDPSLIQGLIRK